MSPFPLICEKREKKTRTRRVVDARRPIVCVAGSVSLSSYTTHADSMAYETYMNTIKQIDDALSTLEAAQSNREASDGVAFASTDLVNENLISMLRTKVLVLTKQMEFYRGANVDLKTMARNLTKENARLRGKQLKQMPRRHAIAQVESPDSSEEELPSREVINTDTSSEGLPSEEEVVNTDTSEDGLPLEEESPTATYHMEEANSIEIGAKFLCGIASHSGAKLTSMKNAVSLGNTVGKEGPSALMSNELSTSIQIDSNIVKICSNSPAAMYQRQEAGGRVETPVKLTSDIGSIMLSKLTSNNDVFASNDTVQLPAQRFMSKIDLDAAKVETLIKPPSVVYGKERMGTGTDSKSNIASRSLPEVTSSTSNDIMNKSAYAKDEAHFKMPAQMYRQEPGELTEARGKVVSEVATLQVPNRASTSKGVTDESLKRLRSEIECASAGDDKNQQKQSTYAKKQKKEHRNHEPSGADSDMVLSSDSASEE